MHCM